jgi:hypothetical protein
LAPSQNWGKKTKKMLTSPMIPFWLLQKIEKNNQNTLYIYVIFIYLFIFPALA